MCQECGAAFELPPAARAKYPGWTPRTCMACRGNRGEPSSSAGRRRGNSASRDLNLTTAQVLERFTLGPRSGVFTDGACSGNPGPGGWGAVHVRDGDVVARRYGHDPATTNNRMELKAVIEGLRMLAPADEVTLYSDSQLVVNTLTKWAAAWEARGWRRREGEVKNLDLVQEAYALLRERPHVRIQWVRAHDGTRWNEYADSLATAYLRDEV